MAALTLKIKLCSAIIRWKYIIEVFYFRKNSHFGVKKLSEVKHYSNLKINQPRP